jgi:hypothetical protein
VPNKKLKKSRKSKVEKAARVGAYIITKDKKHIKGIPQNEVNRLYLELALF